MISAVRACLRIGIAVLIFVLFASLVSRADARAAHGVPKSAPAFAKYVARLIEQALPGTKVAITSRLRLDVEPPNNQGHTTDLHSVYRGCQQRPETCDQGVTEFVAAMVYEYKATDKGPTRASLRVVVRPSGYVAAMRTPTRNHPLAAPLAGDYWIIGVEDRPMTAMMLDESDLKGLNLSPKEAFALAMLNTRTVLRDSLQEQLAKGPCKGILGGDYYAASAAAFPDLWAKMAHRCHDNLLISIPETSVVLYVDGSEPGALKELADYSAHILSKADKPFSNAVFRWTPKGWAFVPPLGK